MSRASRPVLEAEAQAHRASSTAVGAPELSCPSPLAWCVDEAKEGLFSRLNESSFPTFRLDHLHHGLALLGACVEIFATRTHATRDWLAGAGRFEPLR